MLMMAIALMAQAAVAAKPLGHVGTCAWNKIPTADRDRVLLAYHQDRGLGLNTLMDLDVSASLAACAPGSHAPAVFLHRALWAEMTQVGAARELASAGIDRAGIEAAWTRAPGSTRTCLHNRLGPNFGELTPSCTDDAEGEIARSLNIEDDDLRRQASVYYVAKAEGEWAELLIANTPF